MDKIQWVVVLAAVALFNIMYFGCDTNPETHKLIEKQRLENAESTSINSLLMDAKKDLKPADGSSLMALEMDLNNAKDETSKIEAYKSLSSLWYQLEKPAIAGHYAEEVATIENNEEAWSIAGTTFSICIQRESEKKVKDYCTEHAVRALENASSLNPSNLQHQVNLALVYTENPPSENPMKGILMLVNLNKQEPENVMVLNQLGRLAIKTGQFEKAIERLSKAIELEPDNLASNCLLAKAYQSTGDQAKASKYQTQCEQLSID